jgi:hypothetical protein
MQNRTASNPNQIFNGQVAQLNGLTSPENSTLDRSSFQGGGHPKTRYRSEFVKRIRNQIVLMLAIVFKLAVRAPDSGKKHICHLLIMNVVKDIQFIIVVEVQLAAVHLTHDFLKIFTKIRIYCKKYVLLKASNLGLAARLM